jgi:hypothetical protein
MPPKEATQNLVEIASFLFNRALIDAIFYVKQNYLNTLYFTVVFQKHKTLYKCILSSYIKHIQPINKY